MIFNNFTLFYSTLEKKKLFDYEFIRKELITCLKIFSKPYIIDQVWNITVLHHQVAKLSEIGPFLYFPSKKCIFLSITSKKLVLFAKYCKKFKILFALIFWQNSGRFAANWKFYKFLNKFLIPILKKRQRKQRQQFLITTDKTKF